MLEWIDQPTWIDSKELEFVGNMGKITIFFSIENRPHY